MATVRIISDDNEFDCYDDLAAYISKKPNQSISNLELNTSELRLNIQPAQVTLTHSLSRMDGALLQIKQIIKDNQKLLLYSSDTPWWIATSSIAPTLLMATAVVAHFSGYLSNLQYGFFAVLSLVAIIRSFSGSSLPAFGLGFFASEIYLCARDKKPYFWSRGKLGSVVFHEETARQFVVNLVVLLIGIFWGRYL